MPSVVKATPSKSSRHTVKTVFRESQNRNSHDSMMNILTDIYNKTPINVFLPEFIKCLKVCLMHDEHSAYVENSLDFAAGFAVSFSEDLGEVESCPLLEGVLQFIFDSHENGVQAVRLRLCQLINRLLDAMGSDGSLPEDTCEKIAECMLIRLKDRMSSVRTQAVHALHRLQDPKLPDCEIIKAFCYHMTHDPSHEVRRAVVQKIAVSKKTLPSILSRMYDIKDTVRRDAYKVINHFLIRQFTVRQRQLILETGLNDRSAVTREYVIETLIPKWVKFFNNNYYEFLECIHVERIPDTGIKLLKEIFKRQHDVVLESRLREMWIINKTISYEKLNVISVIYWRAMAEFLKPTEEDDKYEEIFEQVLPDLTPFCQYIREYYFPTKGRVPDDGGDGSNKSNTIVDAEGSKSTNEKPEVTQDESEIQDQVIKKPHEPKEDVLIHLLEMCKVFDLSDELGRTRLRQLCCELILSTSPCLSPFAVGTVARLLEHIIPFAEDKTSLVAELVTELREPLNAATGQAVQDAQDNHEKKAELADKISEYEAEMEISKELQDDERIKEISEMMTKLTKDLEELKVAEPNERGRELNNDPDTLKKCLTIVEEVLKRGNVTKMDPTLYSLMENFIIPTLNLEVDSSLEDEALIRRLALDCLGIFCNIDRELAKDNFKMFCFSIAIPAISYPALENVFDLLHLYGLETFDIEDPAVINTSVQEGQPKKPNLIHLLMSLLNSDVPESRKVAVIGLCKLLLAGRLVYVDLVSKLILLWHNPEYEHDRHVRQPLGAFFSLYSRQSRHAPRLISKAVVPTLCHLFNLEVTDPLSTVDPDAVANLLIDMTRPGLNKNVPQNYHCHNQLAILLCEELLNGELQNQQKMVLLRMLIHLEINYKLAQDMTILTALSSRVVKAVGKDRLLIRTAIKFENMLQNHQDTDKSLSTVNNTIPGEGSSVSRTMLIASKDGSGSEEEEEEEAMDDEEELSQPSTTFGLREGSASPIVIPGTPESSDDETEDLPLGPSPVKLTRKSIEAEDSFKRPAVPPSSTPAKGAFKVPTRTPRKAVSTPVEPGESSRSRISDSAIDISVIDMPKTPAKNTRSRLRKTPAKNAEEERESTSKLTRSGRKRKS